MKSNEVKIGQAVATLRARLAAAGCPEPDALAVELLRELQDAGWRPVAPEVFRHQVVPEKDRVTAEQARAYANLAREAMRRHLPDDQNTA